MYLRYVTLNVPLGYILGSARNRVELDQIQVRFEYSYKVPEILGTFYVHSRYTEISGKFEHHKPEKYL